MERICAAHGVPLAAAALQFPLAHPNVAAVLPELADEAQARAALRLVATSSAADFWAELKDAGLLRSDAPTPASGSQNRFGMLRLEPMPWGSQYVGMQPLVSQH